MAPQRTCVGCRRSAPTDLLVRLSRTDDGRLGIGRDRPGRGAWLCRGSRECLEAAIRRKAFDRALRCRVGEDEVAEVRTALLGGVGGGAGLGGPVP